MQSINPFCTLATSLSLNPNKAESSLCNKDCLGTRLLWGPLKLWGYSWRFSMRCANHYITGKKGKTNVTLKWRWFIIFSLEVLSQTHRVSGALVHRFPRSHCDACEPPWRRIPLVFMSALTVLFLSLHQQQTTLCCRRCRPRGKGVSPPELLHQMMLFSSRSLRSAIVDLCHKKRCKRKENHPSVNNCHSFG